MLIACVLRSQLPPTASDISGLCLSNADLLAIGWILQGQVRYSKLLYFSYHVVSISFFYDSPNPQIHDEADP